MIKIRYPVQNLPQKFKSMKCYSGVVFNSIKLDLRYIFCFFFSAMSSLSRHHPSWTWTATLPRFPSRILNRINPRGWHSTPRFEFFLLWEIFQPRMRDVLDISPRCDWIFLRQYKYVIYVRTRDCFMPINMPSKPKTGDLLRKSRMQR